MNTKKKLFGFAALACTLVVTPVLANDTMDVLVTGKQLQVTTSTGAAYTVSFNSNGQYSTSSGSSGAWTMNGDTLCTLKTGASIESCGVLPDGKTVGDSWQTTDSNGNAVTASIV